MVTSGAFPTPHTVAWWPWAGMQTITDEAGNTVHKWGNPQMVGVQGWDIYSSEVLTEHFDGEQYQVFLMTPPEFWPDIKDRFGLPGPNTGNTVPTSMINLDGSLAPGVYEVVGHDVENASMSGWQPGNIILLKVVVG